MKTTTSNLPYQHVEQQYRKLLFAYLHYDGDAPKAMEKCSELLLEVRESDSLSPAFKKDFESLFKDQVSKLYETHENWAKGLRFKFDALFEDDSKRRTTAMEWWNKLDDSEKFSYKEKYGDPYRQVRTFTGREIEAIHNKLMATE